jgi:NAD(P)-dependent dehydrogenase (short-subunit alcohol dehydrogenase family)
MSLNAGFSADAGAGIGWRAMETSTAVAPAPAPRIARLPPERRTAIVVGASSGIGAALVRQLAGEGFRVAALARRAGALDELARSCAAACAASGGAVLTREHDTRDTAAVETLFEPLVRELGGLELLVYAAGIMPKVALTQYDTALDLDIMAVNFGGCVAWCNQAANLFRTQRSGTIVGISSIAGDRGRKGNPVYGASKAAMSHYLEALRNRLGEHGVHVCTIKPGYVDTVMTQGMKGLFWVISAEQAARTILRAARARSNVRYVPLRWTAVGVTIRLIPSVLFRKLSI